MHAPLPPTATDPAAAAEDIARLAADLETTRQVLAETQQLAHVGTWDFDVAHKRLTWSREMYAIFGFDPADGPPRTGQYFATIHPDDRERMIELFMTPRPQPEPYEAHYRIYRSDGSLRHLLGIGHVEHDSEGTPIRGHGTTQDITEIVSIREQLERSEVLLDEAQQIAQVGTFFVDLTREPRQMEWSAQCKVIHGVAPEAPTPPMDFAVVHPEDRQRVSRAAEQALSDGQARIEYRIVRTDGAVRHCVSSMRRARRAGTMVLLGTVQDITERKLQELELVETREQALSVSRTKSQFLANVSHELRTPVAGVLGLVELLGGTTLDPEQREYVEGIDSAARNLLALLNDVLDLAKIEAGKLDIEVLPFCPDQLLREVLAVFQPRAREKGIALRLEIAANVPVSVRSDMTRLRQVLSNLVDNAVKFTAAGHVRIDAAWHEGLLQLTVSDTGIGIAQGRLEAIFEPFVQADGSTTRRFGGTGLGLTITRELVTRMGGDVVAHSELGKGSRFVATVPAPRTEAGASLHPRASQRLPSGEYSPYRVLLAEDNAVNALVLRRWLEKRGMSVHHVTDGAAAAEAALQGAYHVVLMDVQMPDVDGLEATRRIRAGEAASSRHVPVVALTANAMRGDDVRCLEAGMDGYLAKPVDFAALDAALQHHGLKPHGQPGGTR